MDERDQLTEELMMVLAALAVTPDTPRTSTYLARESTLPAAVVRALLALCESKRWTTCTVVDGRRIYLITAAGAAAVGASGSDVQSMATLDRTNPRLAATIRRQLAGDRPATIA